ncbi:unnamed protein product [Lactuca virosa]|uniref:Uncharacterized protein n=1 Tax=Lactuca virosa TaxID=75947 RepID=A0AAU9NDG6_9ASTR|nr:unnamed protein product [Lactuca virosa]
MNLSKLSIFQPIPKSGVTVVGDRLPPLSLCYVEYEASWLFSTFDCTTVYVRQKEDPWNSIIAGAATGNFLQMRYGFHPAILSTFFGGVLLAIIEWAGSMLNKFTSAQQQMPVLIKEAPQSTPNMSPGFDLPNRASQPQM